MTRPSKSPQESGKPPRAAVAACALAGLCALLLMAAAVVLGPPPAEGFASERKAAVLASLAYAARRRLRLMLAPVVGVALVGIAYCVAYVLRFEAILGLNFSLTYALVLVCALELSLDLGLIPSTVFLSRTFDALPLDLAIVSREGETFRATRAARGLSGATRGVLASSAPRSLSWSEPDDADTRHHAWPISGG